MERRLAQAILGLVAVFLVTPVGAEQSDEIVLNAHYGFSGVITKIESGMLFVRSDDNLRPRTISPNKADRVGLHDAKVGDSVTYPLTVSCTSAKFFNAALNTGLGKIDVTPTFAVSIPGNAYAGTYTSTLTLASVSGP